MKTEPRKEHQWLEQLVGEWAYDSKAACEPGKPEESFNGTETARSLGGLWIVSEGQGETPGGGTATTMMTLGYDPSRGRYVGTWVGSMMTWLWLYDGSMDAEQKVLTLESEGPSFTEGKPTKYRDVIELKNSDYRLLTSHALGSDGTWNCFMTAHYRRKK